MRNFDVHVCLVSKQPLPNLIPILVSDPKPKEVILLVSHEMNERAGWLETVLKHIIFMYRKFQLLILMIKKLWKIKCLI